MVDWSIEADTFGNCNCDYNCPCQFELLPTHGSCQGFEVGRIERGHVADIRLDGLSFGVIYAWPGPIFEGNGAMVAIIDERADPDQRNALSSVLHGKETDEAKTHWWVFHAMSSTVHDPIYAPIEFEVDIERRREKVAIPGILEATGRPIVSPATGEEYRVRIDIPNGIEFDIAEIGSASSKATGPVGFELEDTYGQFNAIHLTGRGAVHARV